MSESQDGGLSRSTLKFLEALTKGVEERDRDKGRSIHGQAQGPGGPSGADPGGLSSAAAQICRDAAQRRENVGIAECSPPGVCNDRGTPQRRPGSSQSKGDGQELGERRPPTPPLCPETGVPGDEERNIANRSALGAHPVTDDADDVIDLIGSEDEITATAATDSQPQAEKPRQSEPSCARKGRQLPSIFAEDEDMDLISPPLAPSTGGSGIPKPGTSAGQASSSRDGSTSRPSRLSQDDEEGPSKPTKRRKAAKAVKESRGARYRPIPSKDVLNRLSRVRVRLFLVDKKDENGHLTYAVMGSNGNIYKCDIGLSPRCNCPDFQKRAGGVKEGPCKHLIFIFIRVLKVPKEDPKWWQKRLLPSELQEIRDSAPGVTLEDGVLADVAVRDHFQQSQSQAQEDTGRRPLEGECPVCFEDFVNSEGGESAADVATFCKQCGHNFHKVCLANWIRAQPRATCPLCRASTDSQDNQEADSEKEGYMNLAQYSSSHHRDLTLSELYEDTHRYIGRGGFRGRRRGSGRRPGL